MKLLKKIIKILAIMALVITLTSGIVIWYYSDKEIPVSKFLIDKSRYLVNQYLSVDFTLDSFKIMPAESRLELNNLRLSKYEKDNHVKPFLQIGKLDISIASQTQLLELFEAQVVVETVKLDKVIFDISAPLPDSESKKVEIPWIPIQNIKWSAATLLYEDTKVKLDSLAGLFSRTKENGHLSLKLNEEDLALKVNVSSEINLTNGTALINLNLKQGDVKKIDEINEILKNYNVQINGGNTDLVLAYNGPIIERINEPFKDIATFFNTELYGKANVSDLAVDYQGIKAVLQVNASKAPQDNWEYQINSAFAEGELNVEGKWLGRENALTDYSAKIQGKNIHLTKSHLDFLNIEPFSITPGPIDIAGDLIGDINQVEGTGSIVAQNWKLNDKAIKKLKLHFDLDTQLTLKSNITFDSDFGRAKGKTSIDLKSENPYWIAIDGDYTDFDTSFVTETFQIPVTGFCYGDYQIKFALDGSNPFEYKSNVKVKNSDIYGIKPNLIETLVEGKGAQWFVHSPKVYFENGGLVNLTGIVSEEAVDAKVEGKKIDINLLGIDGENASGTLDFNGTIAGELMDPEIALSMQAYSLNIMGIEGCGLKSELSVERQKLLISPLILSLCDKSMTDGFVSMDLNSGKIEAFNLNFQNMQLETLKPVIPKEYSPETTEGVAAGSVTYNNTKGQNMWNFYLEALQPNLAGQKFQSIYLEGGILGKQAELRNLFVRGFGGNLSLSGQLIDRNQFYGFVEGNSLKYERMDFLEKYLPKLSGDLDFQGNIEWDKEHRSGNFTVFSKNIKTPEQQLGNFGGNITVDDEKLVIHSGEFDKLGLKLTGEMLWEGKKPYNGLVEMSKVDFSFIPRAHGIESIDVGGLLVDGVCEIQGYGTELLPTMAEMKIEQLSVRKDNNILEATKPMQIIYQNESIEVRALELGYQGGILGCEGIFKPGENAALLINGKDFSVEALASLLDLPDAGYKGTLSFDARLLGDLLDPKLYANATIDDFVAVDRKISKIQLEAEVDKKAIKIKEAKAILPNNHCSIMGTIGLSDTLQPSGFDLKVFVPHGSIEDVAFYMPEVIRSASGTVQLDVALTGTVENPIIIGDCMLDVESIQLKDLRRPIKNFKMQVSTKDMLVNLDTFFFELGRGKVVGEGFVNFRDAEGAMEIDLRGEKLDIDYLTLDLDNVDITVKVDGNIMNPNLVSNVYLPRSKFTLNTDLFKMSNEPLKLPFHSFTYDVRVDVPRNFWVKSSFLNSEFAGKFGVFGDLENFKLDGDIRCIQGKLYFKQRQFKIEIGEIKFGGVDNSFDPQIYIKSEGQIQSTKIFLTLTGRLSQFTPQIYSTPPMSEGDILALLTLGRELNASSENDSSKQFEAEIFEGLKNSYISSLVGSTLSEALNLDEVFLTSVFDKGTGKSQPYIRVGKYVSERVFMAYEGTMDQNDKEVYIFEYRLPRGFIVNLEFTEPEQSQKIGVRYDWKFR